MPMQRRFASIRYSLLVLLASPACLAGQIPVPGAPVDQQTAADAEWTRYQRELADSVIRDLVTVLERRDSEDAARLFTDRAHLTTERGESLHGRGSIRDYLEALPFRAQHRAVVSRVAVGPRLVYVAGRLQFREGDELESQLFDALLERHHGYWQVRSLALAPADDALAASTLPASAVAPRDGWVRLPRRSMLRVVVEPVFNREHLLEEAESRMSGYGGGVGLEFDRTLELRGFLWNDPDHPHGDGLLNFGGELRVYLFELWRFRPFVSTGAAWFGGVGVPDTSWVPTAGAGLSVRVHPRLDLQASVRDYLVTTDDGVEADVWFQEQRRHRPLVSAGLSIGLGRRPEWRDDEPPGRQLEYEGLHSTRILERLDALRAALADGDARELGSLYAPGARVYDDGRVLRTADEMREPLRAAGADRPGHVTELRMSDRVAFVDTVLDGAAASRHLLTVLRLDHDAWKIQFQVLHTP